MDVKQGSGLIGEFVDAEEPHKHASGRRSSDRDGTERLIRVEVQLEALEKEQKSFRLEMQEALHGLAEQLQAGLIRVHERVDAIPDMITHSIADHERQEDALYGPRLMAIETGMVQMKEKADKRHEVLNTVAAGVSDLKAIADKHETERSVIIKVVIGSLGTMFVGTLVGVVKYHAQISHIITVLTGGS